MKRLILFYFSYLFLYGIIYSEKIATFRDLITPSLMVMDDKNVYIVDRADVYIYSLKDFILKKKFGKKGDGPGEFKVSTNDAKTLMLNVARENMLISNQTRVSIFSKDGDYINQFDNAKEVGKINPIKNKFVGHESDFKNEIRYLTFNLYDSNFKIIKELCRKESIIQNKDNKSEWKLFSKSWPDITICDKKIFILSPTSEFEIEVYDMAGKKIFAIKENYEKLKFLEEHKNEVLEHYKTSPISKNSFESFWKKAIKFPEYFPAIRSLMADTNKIYVRTYKETKNGSEFYVFDSNGKYLKKVYLSIIKSNLKGAYPYYYDSCPYSIRNNKFYRLIEDEKKEGEWELDRFDIN